MDNPQRGAITLEACVSVLSFLILMLFLSSFFVMFMAQNVTGHAMLQTAQSLSFEAYSEKLTKKDDGSASTVTDNVQLLVKKMFGSAKDNPSFVNDTYWTNDKETEIAQIVKKRFIGYVQGGEYTKADDFLKMLNISKGMDGLDFSGSKIQDGILYITIKYELEYDFNLWGIKPVPVEQTACAKLWQ